MTAHYRLAHLLGVCDGLRAGAGVAVGVHGHDGDEQHLELVHEGLVLAHRQPQVGLQAVNAHGGIMHHCSMLSRHLGGGPLQHRACYAL